MSASRKCIFFMINFHVLAVIHPVILGEFHHHVLAGVQMRTAGEFIIALQFVAFSCFKDIDNHYAVFYS